MSHYWFKKAQVRFNKHPTYLNRIRITEEAHKTFSVDPNPVETLQMMKRVTHPIHCNLREAISDYQALL